MCVSAFSVIFMTAWSLPLCPSRGQCWLGVSESDSVWLCCFLCTDPRRDVLSSCVLSRAYMSVKELKEALQLNSTHFLNVYFASSVREDLAGAATWPWDKEAISHLGK